MKRVVAIVCILALLIPIAASAVSAIDFTQGLVYRYMRLFPLEHQVPKSSFVSSLGNVYMFTVYGVNVMANKQSLDVDIAFVPLMKYENNQFIRLSEQESIVSISAIATLEYPMMSFESVLEAMNTSSMEEAAKIMGICYEALTPDALESLKDNKDGIIAHETSDWKYTVKMVLNYETNTPTGIDVILTPAE